MFEFIKNNISIFSLVISFISLAISLITLYINRKHLDVVIENELDEINSIYLNCFEFKDKNPSLSFGKGKLCFIKVVNPSPKDIAFFDLRVIDVNKVKPIFFLTSAVLELSDLTGQKLFYPANGSMAKINIPYSNYGIFKSNSFTRLDVPFYPSENTKQVLISFKVAITSVKSNKEAGYRKNFKYFKKVFTLP